MCRGVLTVGQSSVDRVLWLLIHPVTASSNPSVTFHLPLHFAAATTDSYRRPHHQLLPPPTMVSSSKRGKNFRDKQTRRWATRPPGFIDPVEVTTPPGFAVPSRPTPPPGVAGPSRTSP